MQNIILLDTEKLTRRSVQHERPSTSTGKTGGSWVPSVPTHMNFLEHLTDWLSVYRGIVWAKEEES